jgi:hypothetical protein
MGRMPPQVCQILHSFPKLQHLRLAKVYKLVSAGEAYVWLQAVPGLLRGLPELQRLELDSGCSSNSAHRLASNMPPGWEVQLGYISYELNCSSQDFATVAVILALMAHCLCTVHALRRRDNFA